VIGRRLLHAAVGILATTLLWASPAAAQCAMCRRALASPEGQQMIAAFRSGILVLLVSPFALFTIIAALAIRTERRRRAESTR
jgi:hypothetical protein